MGDLGRADTVSAPSLTVPQVARHRPDVGIAWPEDSQAARILNDTAGYKLHSQSRGRRIGR